MDWLGGAGGIRISSAAVILRGVLGFVMALVLGGGAGQAFRYVRPGALPRAPAKVAELANRHHSPAFGVVQAAGDAELNVRGNWEKAVPKKRVGNFVSLRLGERPESGVVLQAPGARIRMFGGAHVLASRVDSTTRVQLSSGGLLVHSEKVALEVRVPAMAMVISGNTFGVLVRAHSTVVAALAGELKITNPNGQSESLAPGRTAILYPDRLAPLGIAPTVRLELQAWGKDSKGYWIRGVTWPTARISYLEGDHWQMLEPGKDGSFTLEFARKPKRDRIFAVDSLGRVGRFGQPSIQVAEVVALLFPKATDDKTAQQDHAPDTAALDLPSELKGQRIDEDKQEPPKRKRRRSRRRARSAGAGGFGLEKEEVRLPSQKKKKKKSRLSKELEGLDDRTKELIEKF